MTSKTRYSDKKYEEYLATQATKIQKVWRGYKDRANVVPQIAAMKAMKVVRMRNAAILVQRVYRKRTERITSLATRIQTFYRGYRARMNVRLRKKFTRINIGRKKRIAFFNKVMRFFGKRSYWSRIKSFEVCGLCLPRSPLSVA